MGVGGFFTRTRGERRGCLIASSCVTVCHCYLGLSGAVSFSTRACLVRNVSVISCHVQYAGCSFPCRRGS